MKKILIGSGIAVMFFAAAAQAQGYQFQSNLTVGSTGASVVALQTWLIQNGYHIPSIESGAVSKGLFGSQTKAAVVKYQKAVGLPATGYVGPLTRAQLNGTNTTTATTTAAASPFPPGFSTPGVEGIMTVTQGPLTSTTLYAGETQVPIMDIRIQASYSDIDVGGLLLDLGTDNTLADFVFSKVYVTDGTNILASSTLGSSAVVDDYGRRVLGIDNFNYVIPKGTYKDLVIKADLYPSINSTYTSESPWYISLDPTALAGIDGIGQVLYGPSVNPIIEALNINQSLVTSATANISLDGSSPLVGSVGVTNTTQGQYLGLPVMVFDVNANGDTLHLHSLTVGVTNSGSGTVSAAYLYNGSTPISSASVVNGVATFQNISDGTPGASIPVNTTVPFTVKVDVSGLEAVNGVSPAPAVVSATTTAANLSIYTSIDSQASLSGGATGNAQTVFGAGPVFSLSGAPSIAKTNITAGGATTTTFQYSATFNVNATAIGENVSFALPSYLDGSFGTSSTATSTATVYLNGSASGTAATVIASYSQPSNTTVNGNFFTLSQNQSVTIPVTYSFTVNNPGANTYAVQLDGINWFTGSNGSGTSTATFMANQTQWRTTAI